MKKTYYSTDDENYSHETVGDALDEHGERECWTC